MRVEYINPFLSATINLFRDYMGINLEHDKPAIMEDPHDLNEVSAIIGLAGDVAGAVVLSLSRQTAINIVSKFAGHTYQALSSDVIDGIGELVNIIAGNSKKDLKDHKIVISLPGVITGNSYKMNWPKGVPVIEIPFTSDVGEFSVNVSMKEMA